MELILQLKIFFVILTLFSIQPLFIFEHNQANQLLDIELSIYSINGRLVKKLMNNLMMMDIN